MAFQPFSFRDHGGVTADSLSTFLVHCARENVSDIFIQGGGPLVVSHYGRLVRASEFRLEPQALNRVIENLFTPEIPGLLRAGNVIDRGLQLNGDIHNRYGLARGERLRFRVNFVQATMGETDMANALTLRIIPTKIPVLGSLGIEPELQEALLPHDGLGLVCGETGSGKSTLLASIYQHCSHTQPHRKIVTMEDPIEFILDFPDAILAAEQQQLRRDIASFEDGLTGALRRAPGLIGVGEIRNVATLSGAMANAQTGHLCLSTLHTHSVGEAIPRSLRMFPPEQREAAAHDLLGMLRFVVVQRLLRTTDGKRQAVREFMVFDEDVRSTLSGMDYSLWGNWVDDQITASLGRIADKAWSLYQSGRITAEESLTVMSRKAFRARQEAAA